MSSGVYKRTKETKRKMSESHKGLTPSEETRRKISKTLEGYIMPEETKRKISRTKKGASKGDSKEGSLKRY